MTIFITQGRYSVEALKGMAANPQDRAEAVGKLAEKGGGKLLSYYVTMGENDFLVIMDLPSLDKAMAVMLAAGSSGGIADMKTMIAITSAQAKDVFAASAELRAGFRPAGSSG